jgi:hypothetical protein
VSPVALLVVVGDPLRVRFDELGPALRYREVVVGHPTLNIEHRLHVGLPGFPSLDLFLADGERLVDGQSSVGPEDRAPVGDQRFG